jgi:phage terminase small subunit
VSKNKLTAKEQKFITEYLKCWNGAEAARRAGYSKNTARSIAYENLTKPDIRAVIEEHMKRSAMSADEVLSRISDQARGSLVPFQRVTKDGFLYLDFSGEEAQDSLHLIKEIETKRSRRIEMKGKKEVPIVWEDEQVKIKIHDPQKALDMLARYHNLYAEKDEDGKPITDDERIARVMAILDAARARRDG